MGTSAPEMAVSVGAAIKGQNDIVISNVLGSNIFNLFGSGRRLCGHKESSGVN